MIEEEITPERIKIAIKQKYKKACDLLLYPMYAPSTAPSKRTKKLKSEFSEREAGIAMSTPVNVPSSIEV